MSAKYSQLSIPESAEDFDDEELPSNSTSSTSPKKKTSIICGWTFWMLILLMVMTVGGVGFVMLQDDPNHDLLATLSLGDEEQEGSIAAAAATNQQQIDDSSDYVVSSSSSSSSSSDTDSDSSSGSSSNDMTVESSAESADSSNGEVDSDTSSKGADMNGSADDGAMIDERDDDTVDESEIPTESPPTDNNDEGDDDDDDDDESADEAIRSDDYIPSESAAEDNNNTEGAEAEINPSGAADDTTKHDVDEDDEEEVAIIASLQERLKPKQLQFVNSTSNDLRLHQFLHLHQMKTGGTSLDHYLRCALDRLRAFQNLTIQYGNIHECSPLRYYKCRDGLDPNCMWRLTNASFMSYCAPLKDLPKFQWSSPQDDIRAITVLRNPVDRVWSMFRFQTKSCYYCMNLTDVYDLIDRNETQNFKDICLKQLMNHETANMLSHSELLPHENAIYQQEPQATDLVTEAVDNMKSFFTAIGLTEELEQSVQLFSEIFPWFQSEVGWSERTCALTHDNSSPSNNRCIDDKTHWDLPSHPDEHTRKVIEEHNQLDMAVYQAAVKHFQRENIAVFRS